MSSLVLCYAESDSGAAGALAEFLGANLPVEISRDECVVSPGFDLIDAAERALSAETALILLSPDSAPKTWLRTRWEPVLFGQRAEFGTRLGFVLVRDCKFPELFRRQPFFDLSRDILRASREIKRWLLHPDYRPEREPEISPVVAELRASVADRPGVAIPRGADVAAEFIRLCARDFEAIHHIDCLGRTPAGMVGDLGTAAGIRLPHATEENWRAFERHCAQHRYLFVFENLAERDRDLASIPGLCSAMLIETDPVPVSREDIAAAFFVTPREDVRCEALLAPAWRIFRDLLDEDFESGLRLGWATVSVLKVFERFAEALETLDAMAEAARGRADQMALFRINWERSWLCDSAGAVDSIVPPPPQNTQLELFAVA